MSNNPYRAPIFTNGYEHTQGRGYELPQYPFIEPTELKTGATHRYDIVIVGGGITGLTLACSLANWGVSAILLDEDNTVGVKGASSRGICYTQKSLEIFIRLGIYETINDKGVQWSVGRTFAGHDEVFAFDLRQQSHFNLSEQPPFINIQQFYIEGYLVERIMAINEQKPLIDLRWMSRVVNFSQNTEYAELEVQTSKGNYKLQASHVIDATGSHTPFHEWCNMSMDSKRGDDRWCIADVKFKDTPPTERHTWIEALFNENRAVWQHLMGDAVWRIDYQMAPDADPAYVSREDVVRERLKRQFGDNLSCEIVWVGPYAYKSQCLYQLQKDRVYFAGDTAKVVSPFGARGGNTGIADADNLAWKLANVLKGKAPAQLLQSYNDERLEAAQQNVMITRRTARFLRAPQGIEKLMRSAVIGLAKKHAFARVLINTGRMAVANRYTRSSICTDTGGVSVQNVSFQWYDSHYGQLNDLIRWADGRLLLLIFGSISKGDIQNLQQLSQQWPVRVVQVVTPNAYAQSIEHVVDNQGHLKTASHLKDHQSALIRPDNYLAAHGTGVDARLTLAAQRALAY